MFMLAAIFCLVVLSFSGDVHAAFGDACSATTACTAADHTVCTQVSTCASMGCTTCATGYLLTSARDACKAGHGTACTADGDCDALANSACTNNACACAANNSYSSTYRICYTDGKNLFGEACTTETDCFIPAGSNGACTNNLCDCATGYIKGTDHTCRKPYLYEACTTGVRCIKRTADSSENIPDCTNDICVCPSGTYSATVFGVSGCLTTLASKKANTESCTAHNQCISNFCIQCPDTQGLTCVDSSAETLSRSRIMLALTIFIGMMSL